MIRKLLLEMIKIFTPTLCKCEFELHEVANLKIDPKCIYCGTPLSTYEELTNINV